jgi:hypothetical protein
MRRPSITLLIVVAVALVAGAAGCGTSAQSANLSPVDTSPQSILTAAVAASEGMTAAKGSFDVTISFDVDASQLTEEMKAFVDKPTTVSGTLAYGSDPLAGEFTVAASMAGQTMDLGLKLLGDKAWFRLLDQWYEAPAEMQQAFGDSSGQEPKMAEIEQLMTELGVDPMTWMKDLRLAGEETIDGTAVFHLAGSPDITKIMTDVVQLLQSDEFMKLIDPTGSASGLMGEGSLVPSAADFQEMQTQLGAMFQDLSVDLWVGKDDSMPRKAAIGARIVPPAGEDTGGLNAIKVNATVSLRDLNQAVSVVAPATTKPWSEFEKAIQENPGLFMGLFGGAMGTAGAASVQ